MAEAIARERLPESWRGELSFSSAGTYALVGEPASVHAIDVLHERGIDHTGHRARQLTRELVEESDLVVVMSGRHREAVLELDRSAGSRLLLFGELDDGRKSPDIDDPYGGELSDYRRTRDEIEGLIPLLFTYLADKFDVSI